MNNQKQNDITALKYRTGFEAKSWLKEKRTLRQGDLNQ